MFNVIRLAALLAATIGYRAHGSPDEGPALPEKLHAQEGELAIADVHPLLTLANIRQAAPQMPEAGFLTYLEQARVTAATKVLQDFRDQKQLTGTGKRLLQDLPLTESQGAYRNKIIREGRFVGLALRARPGQRDVGVRVTAVATQFTELEPDLTLYVFHSSDLTTPVHQVALPRLDRVYFEWSTLAKAIDLSSKPGGTWYVGYYERAMRGQAVRLEQNLQQRPGQCCGRSYVQYDQWSPYLQVLPFSFTTTAKADGFAIDGDVRYQSDTNWGLNLRLEAACDLTTWLTGQLPAFQSALRLQLACDLLQLMANSTRDNGLSEKTKGMALLELNNRAEGSQPGLLTQLGRALKALDVDLSGVSPRCLPCAPVPGAIKIKSIV